MMDSQSTEDKGARAATHARRTFGKRTARGKVIDRQRP
jgi:hypothetical protein